MTTHIPVSGDSEEYSFEVKRSKWGKGTKSISITLPTELNQTINNIAVRNRKSRSLVISEILEKGLKENK